MLKGIDISEHQEATPSLDGLSFIALRASIATRKDARYDQHYAAARAAGLVVMAYHYGYSADEVPIASQVETFLAAASDADFLWLDQEEKGFTDEQAQAFIDGVRKVRPCGLYHSASGFGGVSCDARWVADWRDAAVQAGHPLKADGSSEFNGWDLWQYRGSPLDLDYANPDRPLAGLLRRGFISLAVHDSQIADYKALNDDAETQIDILTSENLALAARVATLEAEAAVLQANLAAAPAIERDRIAGAEANRIRAL